MASRIGGQAFDITLGTETIHVESVTCDITDDTATAFTRGMPDGYVNGKASAEGEFEFDIQNFKKITASARSAGSYRKIPLTDILFYANTGDEELKVEVFGVKLIVTSPLSGLNPEGGEKTKQKVKFLVTSPEFIRIDGVPILSEDDVRGLIG